MKRDVVVAAAKSTSGGVVGELYPSNEVTGPRIGRLKRGKEWLADQPPVKVEKKKMAPPFKQAEFDIIYGEGISRQGGLIDMGVEEGIVKKSGAWFTYDGDQLGQGKENARRFLKDNPDLADEIESRIKEKLGIGARLDAPAEAEAEVDF